MSQETHVSSHQVQRACVPNVLIFGETGVGKSSVVNLIAGEQLADVSAGANGCTMEATSYDVALTNSKGQSHRVRLFDTVGLNEPSLSKTDYLTAIEKAYILITQLQRTGGIRLLIFCIRGRITAVTQNNYHLFRDILCQNQVPVAFVITGMENEQPMESWWSRNARVFEKSKLSCDSHVCITATRGLGGVYATQYIESQTVVRRMLLGYLSSPGGSWKPEHTGWFVHLAGKLLRWVAKIRDLKRHLPVWSKSLAEEDLAFHLQDKCNFSREEAVELARRIWAKRAENSGPEFVKMGDSGVADNFSDSSSQ